MNRIERKSLLLALSITISITGLLMYYFQLRSFNVSPLTTVVVALNNIPAKSVITDKFVQEIAVPQKFAATSVATSKSQVVGQVARDPIYSGEQILRERLVQGKERDGLAAIIPKGERAVTIKIDAVSGVAGQIKEGDSVDIMVHLGTPYRDEDVIQTAFQNIEVFDAGATTSSSTDRYLTLRMTPEQAERLFMLEQIGKLKLVLRNFLDENVLNLPVIDAQTPR